MPFSKSRSRKEILTLVDAMVQEFERRAAFEPEPTEVVTEQIPSAVADLRTARVLKELASIARGDRAPTYWLSAAS